jgi:hypothetical protein
MFTTRSTGLMMAGSLLALVFTCAACSETGVTSPSAPESQAFRVDITDEFTVPIDIAPSMLVLDSPGTCVTVHAEIAYGDVDHDSLLMNGVSPSYTKADARGELVVKFEREDIQNIVSPPEATLTLTGLTVDGTPFTGSDTITVS